jgi:hypothetical protein
MRLLIIPVLAMFALVLSADRAHACTCFDPGLAADMKHAAIVFVGTVTAVETSKITIAVEGVWKGTPGKTIVVDPGSGAGDCSFGRRFGKGTRWLIFLRAGPPYRLRLCAGNQRATPAVIETMTKKFGAPKAP